MASYVTNEHLSISHDRVPMAEGLTSNPQHKHRQRPKACQCCRARKVKCKAAQEESSTSRSRAAISKRRPQKKESKPWFRTPRLALFLLGSSFRDSRTAPRSRTF